MLMQHLSGVRSILCLGCHADDIEIGCGGTLLKLLAANPDLHITWVVLSAADSRRAEAIASAEGFLSEARNKEIVVGEFRDTLFPFDGEAIKAFFARLAGKVQPDLIFTHRREDLHQDHRTAAEFTWCSFRNHWIWEYEIPKYEGDLGHPNTFVSLDVAVAEQKIENLWAAFPTQQTKPWFSRETFWALLRIRGLECQSPTHLAEGFHCRKTLF
jgi:LmbE family N-acetylglucosaminyl deacetylase